MKTKKQKFNGHSYLFVLDFDQTLFLTNEQSPKGMTVEKAYRLAIRDLFGASVLESYDAKEGLRNRAPSEVIGELQQAYALPQLTQSAKSYLTGKQINLEKFMLQSKGGPTVFEQAGAKRVLTELLVRVKLAHLVPHIGTRLKNGAMWPRPCPGVVDFLKEIERWNDNRPLNGPGYITLAILSSGHDYLIREIFNNLRIDIPAIIVTDDDMRKEELKVLPAYRRVKPSTFLMATVQGQWFALKYGMRPTHPNDLIWAENSKRNMVYLGDGIVKDQPLAEQYGISFLLYDPQEIHDSSSNGTFMTFNHWHRLLRTFKQYGPEGIVRPKVGNSGPGGATVEIKIL